MIYNVYQLKTEYGEPGELLLKTENRHECMKKVAELINAGETAATIRVITEQGKEKRTPGHEAWRYYY